MSISNISTVMRPLHLINSWYLTPITFRSLGLIICISAIGLQSADQPTSDGLLESLRVSDQPFRTGFSVGGKINIASTALNPAIPSLNCRWEFTMDSSRSAYVQEALEMPVLEYVPMGSSAPS